MPIFAYQSMNTNGKIVRGRLSAANLPDLEMRLKRLGLDLIDGIAQAQGGFSLRGSRVKRSDLINFCFHMEQLSTAGVPLLEGLADLRDSAEHPPFREIMADLIESIEGGLQLSAALAMHPDVFDLTFTSLIRAGEASGTLGQIFLHLSESIKWQDELTSKAKTIMLYPALVGTVVIGVAFFLMMYLVPQLTSFIKNMGEELPLHTLALIFVSGIFIDYWPFLISVPLGLLALSVLAVKRYPGARMFYHRKMLRVWLVGPILHKVILARFVTFFALMYGSGITVLDSLRLAEGVVNNVFVSAGLRRAAQLISEGHGISAAFQTSGIFPPLIIRMLRVGETTGALERSLRNAAYFYDREINESIAKVQAVIEPIMTVALGALLGWIMISVLGPIYDTISKIKP